MLGRRHVQPDVLTTLHTIQVEGTFTTGTYLVTVHDPIASDDGDIDKALYGSFLPVPSKDAFPPAEASEYETKNQPGAVIPVKEGRIVLNEGRKRIRLKVTSKGDRPIQVRARKKFESYLIVGLVTYRLFIRSDHTTTSSKQTLNSNSTESEHTGFAWISQLEPRFDLNPAIPRLSHSLR